MNVNLGLENGIVNARFLVDNNETKDLLMQNLNNIMDQLEEAGITVGEFQVNVRGDRNFQKNDDTENIEHVFSNIEDVQAVSTLYDINSLASQEGGINLII